MEPRRGHYNKIVALQPVMADLLCGDTTHHACGIQAFGRNNSQSYVIEQQQFAHRILQMRWLIVDEIRMVGATLSAEVDYKLRSLMLAARTLICCSATTPDPQFRWFERIS